MSEVSHRMDAAERRTAIVQAAMPLFARQGLSGVTTREIASAAGVSEALLYRHFDSKEALFEASQSICLEESHANARRIEAYPDSTGTLVAAVFVMMFQVGGMADDPDGRRRHMRSMFMRSLLAGDGFAPGLLAAASEPWIPKIRRCWESARAAGDLVDGVPVPEFTVWMGHHLATGCAFMSLHGAPIVALPLEGEQFLIEQTRFVLRGVGLKPEVIDLHFKPELLLRLVKEA
ncbi:MAG: helix-turn-helix domain-containing protein [Deltaproteobacteria bacterium]|nr:helix-turn-helix domain-containing protein [Deltaproteobacteria bacterium]